MDLWRAAQGWKRHVIGRLAPLKAEQGTSRALVLLNPKTQKAPFNQYLLNTTLLRK